MVTALGFFAGVVIGSVSFLIGNLSGWPLFALTGGAVGAAVSFAVHTYSGSARLTSVTLNVLQVTQMEFAITRDSQQVAWKIFVEVSSRVSVQKLDQGSGYMREAMSSLHGLFLTL